MSFEKVVEEVELFGLPPAPLYIRPVP